MRTLLFYLGQNLSRALFGLLASLLMISLSTSLNRAIVRSKFSNKSITKKNKLSNKPVEQDGNSNKLEVAQLYCYQLLGYSYVILLFALPYVRQLLLFYFHLLIHSSSYLSLLIQLHDSLHSSTKSILTISIIPKNPLFLLVHIILSNSYLQLWLCYVLL